MKYFTIPEFEHSLTAALKGYDNEAPREVRRNIEYLVDTVLDPLREAMGFPLVITSGYRCTDLNRDVGGSPTSQHLLGLAADFRPNYTSADEMAERMDRIRGWFRERLTDYQTNRLADDSRLTDDSRLADCQTNRLADNRKDCRTADECLDEGSMAEVLSDSLNSPKVCQSEEESLKVAWDQMIDYGTFFHVGIRPEDSTNRFQMLKRNSYGQGYRKD